MDPLTTRAHSPGQFHFVIDGHESFMVKSFEGGLPKGNTAEEAIGTTLHVIKHLTTFEIEPLTIEVGMQDGLPMLKWIRDSWTTNYCRKNGTCRLADFNLKNVKEYSFTNGLITETTFPTLDGGAKEGATLKVKIQPEVAQLDNGDGKQIVGQAKSYEKQKLWNVSCFELDLKGYDTRGVAKIDGFTVKQGVKSYSTGRDRYPFWEPTKLTFPDISVHMSLAHADSMVEWYRKTCQQRNTDPSLQTTGSIFYLSPDRSKHVFEIKLMGVGLKGMTIDKAERGDSPRRVKFDLYVSEMDISTGGVLAY
jgi:hypothetical protein